MHSAPWWAIPAAVLMGALVGGWVLTHAIKLALRGLRGGRKPPNWLSILLGACVPGALAAALAVLAAQPPATAAFLSLLVGLPAPLLFPVLVTLLAAGAESRAAGYGDKVRRVMLGAERARRPPAPDEPPAEEDPTLLDRTRTWWSG